MKFHIKVEQMSVEDCQTVFNLEVLIAELNSLKEENLKLKQKIENQEK